MPVIITVGQNSYVNITDAQTYFDSRLFADTWTNAIEDDKVKALIMASKKIDRQPLRGKKIDINQIMEFPRMLYSYEPRHYGIYNMNVNTKQYNYGPGWYIQESVPQEVLDATCEEALALLQYGNSKRIALQKQGVTAFNLSGMSESLKGDTIRFLSQEAKELLTEFLAGSVIIA
ncbi:MAG: hypothetical protein K0R54_5308 [Clostridiaceae bacterium]|nr:hypothetical protein [Clostridiaceae bacterium]